MERKFNDWYSNQITDHFNSGVSLEDVYVKLYLSIIKTIHAGWIVNPYNQMNSVDARKTIESGCLTTGIHDAIWLGLNKLPYVYLFEDIDPMIKTAIPATNLHALCAVDKEEIAVAYSREFVDDNDADLERELPDKEWDAFSIF